MGARTTADLLTDVAARASRPSGDLLVTTAELLQLCDEELRSEVAGMIISARSEYWLASETTTVVSGTASYRLPDRALAQGLRDVTIVDANGYEWNADQVPANQRYLYSGATCSRGPGPFDFTLENGQVVLLPTPSQSGYTMRLRYYRRPGRLIQTSAAIFIERPLTTTTLELDNSTTAPSTISTVDARVDIIRGDGMCDAIFTDRIVDGYAGNTLTLDSTTPIVTADINESNNLNTRFDYVCPAGTTVYPPLPEDLYPFLVALGVKAYAEAIGDAQAFQIAAAMAEKKRKLALGIITPRVDGEELRPVPLNTPLRSGSRWGWGGGW